MSPAALPEPDQDQDPDPNPDEARASEEDEDVREAKANIKGHLDRMREMEKFLKSMQEEEERFQRQRQDVFLFDSLLLSSRLNGLKHAAFAPSNGSFEPAASMAGANLERRARGHSSAPIGCYGNPFEAGAGAGPGQTVDVSRQAELAPAPMPVSCFSSDSFYRPSMGLAQQPPAPLASYRPTSPIPGCPDYSQDPLLEPVQPFRLSLGQPAPVPGGMWRRSKSQLSDQYKDHLGPSRLDSDAHAYRAHQPAGADPSTGPRRPLSANLDSLAQRAGGQAAYFPSRQRRSVSQMRRPINPEPAFERPVMSEYRSSFGPNLGARSPLRRATSPANVATRHRAKTYGTGVGSGVGSGSDDDRDHDDDMRDYRASSYVPKLAAESLGNLSANRPGRSLDRRSSTLNLEASGRASMRLPSRGAPAELAPNERRKSWQTLAEFDSRPSSSPSRRRSLAADSGRPLGANLDNPRLSELEQRIQANKRRRQELLTGIKSNAVRANGDSAPQQAAPEAGREPARDSGEDEQETFGFERPSRAAACKRNEHAHRAEAQPSPARVSAAGSPRTRPSRLESMEARIKRRSYCVRVGSPERARTKPLPSATRTRSFDEEAGE